jgi:hypothetical protein
MAKPAIFPHLFNPADLGGTLKEVATDFIHTSTDQNVLSRWFHSVQDADLYIWLDDRRRVIKQQLSFYGTVVEWNAVEGLKTGMVIEEEREDKGQRRNDAELIQFDTRPQKNSIVQAMELLRHVTSLSSEERGLLMNNFADSASSISMDADEFARRFGELLPKPGAILSMPSRWRLLWLRFKRFLRLSK